LPQPLHPERLIKELLIQATEQNKLAVEQFKEDENQAVVGAQQSAGASRYPRGEKHPPANAQAPRSLAHTAQRAGGGGRAINRPPPPTVKGTWNGGGSQGTRIPPSFLAREARLRQHHSRNPLAPALPNPKP